MSIRWDSPKDEWDQACREWNKTPENEQEEKRSAIIQNILSAVVLLIVAVFSLAGRL